MSHQTSIKLSDGTTIPQLGFGVYKVDTKDAVDSVYHALKVGYRHIDTAEAYYNELEAAKAIKNWIEEDPVNHKREDIYFTTKISPKRISHSEAAASIKDRVAIVNPLIGYIDLVLLHAPMGSPEDRVGAYKALEEYKTAHPQAVRSFGVSNYGVKHIKELLDSEPKFHPVVNQIELNPWLTRKEIVDYCEAHGIAMQAYSPLTRGIRVTHPEITALAKKYGKTNGQILIKWSLQHGFIPLAKSVTPSRIEENFQVFDFELSDEDFKALTHDDLYWVSHPNWDPSKLD
ncbi:hypothetical protein DASC09_043260 [Saccharomycopsis crataegensis]|uniref:NADP-dependent oxidoreductase domain-containing protein n=1 Tax=Saccharomycopsis crataegensis TaxID=43959 RepID=A0AAV5QQJ5_9ASCO|nr:hypothetical protein DASC09_043260 [Saccharomycopsis crataegensis]